MLLRRGSYLPSPHVTAALQLVPLVTRFLWAASGFRRQGGRLTARFTGSSFAGYAIGRKAYMAGDQTPRPARTDLASQSAQASQQ
jgi:hypothetical protein